MLTNPNEVTAGGISPDAAQAQTAAGPDRRQRTSAVRNNFDLLRLLLAATVMLVHAHTLSEADELAFLPRLLNSTYAVQAFFVISGYLIAMSYDRSRSVRQFASKRVRRLVPAYVTVVVVAAVAGALLTTLPALVYLTSPQVYAYLAANLTFLNFLQPSLPGVFADNPHVAVDGALWSIRSEIACYAMVPAVYWFASRVGRGFGALATMAFFAATSAGLLWLELRTGKTVFAQLRFSGSDCGLCFACGIATWYLKDRLGGRWFTAACLGCVGLLVSGVEFGLWAELFIRPVLLTGGVMFVALQLPHLGNWGRYGDLSYGVYIYHFPVIQCLVAAGWFAAGPFTALAVSVGVTLALAALSWWLIEAPWLARDSHYVRAASHAREPRSSQEAQSGSSCENLMVATED
jgi:peptidoglycan/LPS O-acetylase OafA/YrhL